MCGVCCELFVGCCLGLECAVWCVLCGVFGVWCGICCVLSIACDLLFVAGGLLVVDDCFPCVVGCLLYAVFVCWLMYVVCFLVMFCWWCFVCCVLCVSTVACCAWRFVLCDV